MRSGKFMSRIINLSQSRSITWLIFFMLLLMWEKAMKCKRFHVIITYDFDHFILDILRIIEQTLKNDIRMILSIRRTIIFMTVLNNYLLSRKKIVLSKLCSLLMNELTRKILRFLSSLRKIALNLQRQSWSWLKISILMINQFQNTKSLIFIKYRHRYRWRIFNR
jgi:hypothetical protein